MGERRTGPRAQLSLPFTNFLDLEHAVVVQALKLDGDPAAIVDALAAQDLGAHLDWIFAIGEMDDDVKLVLIAQLVGIDEEEHPAAAGIDLG